MNKRFFFGIGAACAILGLLVLFSAIAPMTAHLPTMRTTMTTATQVLQAREAAAPITTTQNMSETQMVSGAQALSSTANLLTGRYEQLHPGVVSIFVVISSTQTSEAGAAAGSGFILDNEGHIVTNNHVVANAMFVMVAFADGAQEQAKVLGTDVDSDLAVIQVNQLPQGMHALPLGNSDKLQVGDWAIAIGNPFGLGGSMTLGIVSALGRSIPSGVTPFSIPGTIQTDAAINPGNSGGPLLNMAGEVVGINAQIETGGMSGANTGVGFAIPAKVVQHVVPTLITKGAFQWPWLGITGGNVGLLLTEANKLPSQKGAYISQVVPDGPAQKAGLQGSSSETNVNGLPVETGGDVVVQIDNQPINAFDDLLSYIAFKAPGDKVTLTVLRGGQRQQIPITLAPRPANLKPDQIRLNQHP